MKKPVRTRLLRLFLLLVLVLAAGHLVVQYSNHRVRAAIAETLAGMERRGCPVTWPAWRDRCPPVEEREGARHFFTLAEKEMMQRADSYSLWCSEWYDTASDIIYEDSIPSWERPAEELLTGIGTYLEAQAVTMALIREGSRRRVDLRHHRLGKDHLFVPCGNVFDHFFCFLGLASLFHVHQEQPDQVLADLQAMDSLALYKLHFPWLVNCCIGQAWSERVMRALECACNHLVLDRSRLDRLRVLGRERRIPSLRDVLACEALVISRLVEGGGSLDLSPFLGRKDLGTRVEDWLRTRLGHYFAYHDRTVLNSLHNLSNMLEIPPGNLAARDRVLQEMVARFERPHLARMTGTFHILRGLVLTRRMIGTSLAVERPRLDRAAEPERLADLQPAWLERIPVDPWDGTPLRYTRLEPGYRITPAARVEGWNYEFEVHRPAEMR